MRGTRMFQWLEKGYAMEHVLMSEDLLARKDDAGNTQTLYDHLRALRTEAPPQRIPQAYCMIPAKPRMTSSNIC